MLWFRKRKVEMERLKKSAQITDREITAHKDAKQQVIQDAKEANMELKKLLVANGFTFKIYLGAGGRAPQTHRGTK